MSSWKYVDEVSFGYEKNQIQCSALCHSFGWWIQKILAEAEVMVEYGPEKNATKKSSDDSIAIGGLLFKSLFWCCQNQLTSFNEYNLKMCIYFFKNTLRYDLKKLQVQITKYNLHYTISQSLHMYYENNVIIEFTSSNGHQFVAIFQPKYLSNWWSG